MELRNALCLCGFASVTSYRIYLLLINIADVVTLIRTLLFRTKLVNVGNIKYRIFNYILLYFLKYLKHPQTLECVCILNKAFVRWACRGSHRRVFCFFGPRKPRRSFFLQYSSPNLYVQNSDSLLLYVDLTGHNRNVANFHDTTFRNLFN